MMGIVRVSTDETQDKVKTYETLLKTLLKWCKKKKLI